MATKTDLTEEIRNRLHLGDERTGDLSLDEALPVLLQLADDIQAGQRAIGMVLWHLDPSPADMIKIAERLNVRVETLKSWLNTYSRLRHDAELATLNFSRQQQLARIMNTEDRAQLWNSRPEYEWTLPGLTSAVDEYMDRIGSSVMPRTKKAGMKGRFQERELKVNLELFEGSVELRLTVSEGRELDNIRFDKISEGIYRVQLDW